MPRGGESINTLQMSPACQELMIFASCHYQRKFLARCHPNIRTSNLKPHRWFTPKVEPTDFTDLQTLLVFLLNKTYYFKR
jgi:hypothetical protein